MRIHRNVTVSTDETTRRVDGKARGKLAAHLHQSTRPEQLRLATNRSPEM